MTDHGLGILAGAIIGLMLGSFGGYVTAIWVVWVGNQ